NGAEAAVGSERRRSAALAEPGLSKNDGGTGRDEVDGHPGDDLVAAMGNRGEAVNECEKAGNEDRRAQPDPCGAVDCGSGAGGEGTCQHLAFETDVEDAGTLRIETRETGQKQRDRQADRGVEDDDEGVEELHLRRLPAGQRSRPSSSD